MIESSRFRVKGKERGVCCAELVISLVSVLHIAFVSAWVKAEYREKPRVERGTGLRRL